MLRENKPGIFANLLLLMLMSSSICQALYTSLFMTYKLSLTLFPAVVFLTLLFYMIFMNKITRIVSAIILTLSLIVSLGFVFSLMSSQQIENRLYSYINWLIDLSNGYTDVFSSLYTNLTLIGIAFIITLPVFLFTIKFYNFYVLCILGLSVFFVQLQLGIFVSKTAFILFVFSLLLYYFFNVLRRRSKDITYDSGNKLKYLFLIIPICAAVIAFSLLLPIKSSRISWPWLDNKIDGFIDGAIDSFSGKDVAKFDYFSIKSSGFGSDDNLGGNITPNKTNVMNVKSDYSNLYLKASSKAFYNGHGWYNDKSGFTNIDNGLKSYRDEINSDSNELVAGNLLRTGNKFNDEIYKAAKVEIEYVNLKTKSLFIPLKTYSLDFNKPMDLFFDSEQMISTNEFQKKNFKYTINYNYIMLKSDKFKADIRKSYIGYYAHNLRNIFDNMMTGNSKLFRGLMGDVASSKKVTNDYSTVIEPYGFLRSGLNDIYNKYTSLPGTVTPRVRQLAEEITKDQTNNYDKAKAIETYLSVNYPYTLKPGNPPREQDFVDYFLFDGKKGYCTYYASAMTVLLRCINIPARYVEGYILPPEKEKGVYKVTNEQAHAWVEVYFEGFGWISFEPTSPFVANMYNDKNISASISSNMINSGYDDYINMLNKYRNSDQGGNYNLPDTVNITPEKTDKPLLTVIIIIISVIGSILLILGSIAIINSIRAYSLLRRIKKASPNDGVLMAYQYILKILKLHKTSISAGETPSQFGVRVEKQYDFRGYTLDKTNFTVITDYYISARYSGKILTAKAQLDMLGFIDVLLQLTHEKFGKLRYNTAKYILGKI